jgi:hypothetical protein
MLDADADADEMNGSRSKDGSLSYILDLSFTYHHLALLFRSQHSPTGISEALT